MTRIPTDDGKEPVENENAGEQPAVAPAEDADAAKLREERDALYDKWVRAKAESENMRKRLQAEFDQRAQYANQSLIKSLLPVIDNFERALKQDASKVDAASILKGMQIVHDQWLSVLKQQQVEEIAPEPGTPFDPTRHEALMQQESEYKAPTVTMLMNKGYALQGRVIRPAQVAVSKNS
jgi:molecular chaperone GrpE